MYENNKKFFIIYLFCHPYLYIQNSYHEFWTNAQFVLYIYWYNEYFIKGLSYYQTKRNWNNIIMDEINSEAPFFILADGIPLV